ncbi:MAG: hypothetical protein KDE51_26145 [Anaerolineales bacterium]|nr:hypothetical protein [Anaerolineales bacterium]
MKSTITTLVTILLQLILSYLLWFTIVTLFSLGNGREITIFPVTTVIGVWGVGQAAAKILGRYQNRAALIRLGTTILGTILGIVAIYATPAIGFAQILFPLIGSMLGYYLTPKSWLQ